MRYILEELGQVTDTKTGRKIPPNPIPLANARRTQKALNRSHEEETKPKETLVDKMEALLKKQEDFISFQDDHADDEDPHPSDYSEIVDKLKTTSDKKIKLKKGWYYVYGGNGSGRLVSSIVLRDIYIETKPNFTLEYGREVYDYEGKKLKKWLNKNFDSEERDFSDFEPTQLGDITIIVKVKDDKQRKEAINWFESFQKASEKVLYN